MIELTIRLQIAYCFVLPAIEENILNSHLKQRLTTIRQHLKIESLIGIGFLDVSHNHFPYLYLLQESLSGESSKRKEPPSFVSFTILAIILSAAALLGSNIYLGKVNAL
jgi:hypothetical protein